MHSMTIRGAAAISIPKSARAGRGERDCRRSAGEEPELRCWDIVENAMYCHCFSGALFVFNAIGVLWGCDASAPQLLFRCACEEKERETKCLSG